MRQGRRQTRQRKKQRGHGTVWNQQERNWRHCKNYHQCYHCGRSQMERRWTYKQTIRQLRGERRNRESPRARRSWKKIKWTERWDNSDKEKGGTPKAWEKASKTTTAAVAKTAKMAPNRGVKQAARYYIYAFGQEPSYTIIRQYGYRKQANKMNVGTAETCSWPLQRAQ